MLWDGSHETIRVKRNQMEYCVELAKKNCFSKYLSVTNDGVFLVKPALEDCVGGDRLLVLEEALNILEAQDLEHAVIKTLTYPPKDVNDFDILIDTDSICSTEKIFEKKGFQSVEREYPYKIKLVKKSTVIDLYNEIVEDDIIFMDKRNILDTASTVRVGDFDVPVPSNENEVLLILVNSVFGDDIRRIMLMYQVLFNVSEIDIDSFLSHCRSFILGCYLGLVAIRNFNELLVRVPCQKLNRLIQLIATEHSLLSSVVQRNMACHKNVLYNMPQRYPLLAYVVALGESCHYQHSRAECFRYLRNLRRAIGVRIKHKHELVLG